MFTVSDRNQSGNDRLIRTKRIAGALLDAALAEQIRWEHLVVVLEQAGIGWHRCGDCNGLNIADGEATTHGSGCPYAVGVIR